MTHRPDSPPAGATLSVADASEATGVPAATIHRYAEHRILPPDAARGVAQGRCPQRLLPVLTTLRIMELVDCDPDRMRAIATTLADLLAAAGTDEEERRLAHQVRTFQAHLVEKGPHPPELSEVIGPPLPPAVRARVPPCGRDKSVWSPGRPRDHREEQT